MSNILSSNEKASFKRVYVNDSIFCLKEWYLRIMYIFCIQIVTMTQTQYSYLFIFEKIFIYLAGRIQLCRRIFNIHCGMGFQFPTRIKPAPAWRSGVLATGPIRNLIFYFIQAWAEEGESLEETCYVPEKGIKLNNQCLQVEQTEALCKHSNLWHKYSQHYCFKLFEWASLNAEKRRDAQ